MDQLTAYHCGEAYHTDSGNIGKTLNCRRCGELFAIEPPPRHSENIAKEKPTTPLWNWLVMLYPLSALLWAWTRSGKFFVGWIYGIANLGYLLLALTIYPGKFQLLSLHNRWYTVCFGVFLLFLSIVLSAAMIKK